MKRNKGTCVMKRLSGVFALAGFLLAGGFGAVAQTPQTAAPAATPPAPPAVTATCKDGFAFSGASRSGACRGHGGVQTWGTAAATPTNAAPTSGPAGATPTAGSPPTPNPTPTVHGKIAAG